MTQEILLFDIYIHLMLVEGKFVYGSMQKRVKQAKASAEVKKTWNERRNQK